MQGLDLRERCCPEPFEAVIHSDDRSRDALPGSGEAREPTDLGSCRLPCCDATLLPKDRPDDRPVAEQGGGGVRPRRAEAELFCFSRCREGRAGSPVVGVEKVGSHNRRGSGRRDRAALELFEREGPVGGSS